MAAIKQWFMMLNQREQILVSLAGTVLLIAFIWLVLFKPLITQNKALQAGIEERQTELRWMQSSGQTIKQLRVVSQSNGGGKAPPNPSRLIEQALNQYGLKKGLQRMQGRETVNLTLKDVNADQVMTLLGKLEFGHHLYVKTMDITPKKDPGIIDITLTIGK